METKHKEVKVTFLKATELVKSRGRVHIQAVQHQSLCTESSWFLVGSMDLHSFEAAEKGGWQELSKP